MRKYTAKYFHDRLPEWKRKKDTIFCKLIYRPISFYTAAFCANHGINANTVSYFSSLVAILGCVLFVFDNYYCHIAGGVIFNLWIILDCTDGNLARCYKKQPFGEYADAMSSYILVGLMSMTMGVAVYQSGGLFVDKGWYWIILIGAIGSSSDSLMRLIYQKYVNVARKMSDEGYMEPEVQKQTLPSEVGSLRVRLDAELGIAGLLPCFILLASIFNFLDLVVFYTCTYYGSCCVVMTLSYVKKAMRHTEEWESKIKAAQ